MHVVHWILNLGLGGDAKNLVALALEQKNWATVSVLTQLADAGPRADVLRRAGIDVMPNMVPGEILSQWIVARQPSLVVIHRNGAPNSIETSVLEEFVRHGVPCFEYNTFARVDADTDKLWTGHAHLSRASLLQYCRRRGLAPESFTNQRAIGYAVAVPPAISDDERQDAKHALGIPDNDFVVTRLMRPDLRKWDPLPVLAIEKLLKKKMPVHLLLHSAPSERHGWIKSVLGSAVTLREPTVNESDLQLTLTASNCVVNYSAIGETFGLGLAEAMVAGLPVIVNSTVGADNAQIELCRHNERGYVANNVASLSSALGELIANPEKATQLGHAGRDFMIDTFAPSVVEKRLRRFIIDCLQGAGSTVGSEIPAPELNDQYLLTPEWLLEYERSEKETAHSCGESSCAVGDFIDNLRLKKLRLEDAFLYARSIGASGVIEKLSRRLSQGSILRS